MSGVGEAVNHIFRVILDDGDAGTGLTSSDFTATLQRLSSGALITASEAVTITELSAGDYLATYTPTLATYYRLRITEGAFSQSLGLVHEFEDAIGAGAITGSSYLSTLVNLREHIGKAAADTADDSFLTNLLDRATQRVERIVGRVLRLASYTEYVDGGDTSYLNLRQGPLVTVSSVSSVTYATDGTESYTVESAGNYFARGLQTDGWCLPGWIEANSFKWSKGQRNYRVIYTAGYSTVPADLEEAVLRLAIWWFNERKDVATASRDVGSGAMSFRDPSDLVAELRESLAPYMAV